MNAGFEPDDIEAVRANDAGEVIDETPAKPPAAKARPDIHAFQLAVRDVIHRGRENLYTAATGGLAVAADDEEMHALPCQFVNAVAVNPTRRTAATTAHPVRQ